MNCIRALLSSLDRNPRKESHDEKSARQPWWMSVLWFLVGKIGDGERDYVSRMGRARIEQPSADLAHLQNAKTAYPRSRSSDYSTCHGAFIFHQKMKDEMRPRGPQGCTPARCFYNGKIQGYRIAVYNLVA
jgi:hypothetical protein